MRLYLLGVILAISGWTYGQGNVFYTGLQPETSLEFSPAQKWNIDLEAKTMQVGYGNYRTEELIWKHYNRRVDLQAVIDRKVGSNLSLGVGYKYRFQQGSNMQRSLQQIKYKSAKENFKLEHRFRGEQSFKAGSAPEIRFRYRLKATIPLTGPKIDPQEYFMSISGEQIYGFKGEKQDLDSRATIYLGYLVNEMNEISGGIHYRIDEFLYRGSRQQLWFDINWAISL